MRLLRLFGPNPLNPTVYLLYRDRIVWRVWAPLVTLARFPRRMVQGLGVLILAPLIWLLEWLDPMPHPACHRCGRMDQLAGAGAGCAACLARAQAFYHNTAGHRP